MQRILTQVLLLLVLAIITPSLVLQAQSAQGQTLLDSLLRELPNKQNDSAKVMLLEDIGYEYAIQGSDVAKSYFERCLILSREIKWQRGIGSAYSLFAFLAMKKSNFSAAIRYCDSSYDAHAAVNWIKGMANALNTKGVAYEYLGLPAEALKIHFQSLNMKAELNDTLGIVRSYINIGNSHSSMKNDTKALEMYNKALELGKRADLGLDLLPVFVNVGQTYVTLGQFDKAAGYFREAELLSQRFGDVTAFGEIFNNRGEMVHKKNELSKAFEYYSLALQKDTELENWVIVTKAHTNMGRLYQDIAIMEPDSSKSLIASLRGKRLQLLQKAKEEFLKAIEIGTSINDRMGIMNGYQLLSENEAYSGNSKLAFEYFKKYTLYKDSIYNDENKNKFVGLEMKYLEDSKNKEISLLNKDKALQAAMLNQKNQLILFIIIGVAALAGIGIVLFWSYNKRRKAQFAQRVTEMENQVLRLQMNPHFIFNSLHAVNKYMLDNEKEKASDYLSCFSRLMRLTLENSRQQEVLLSEDLEALELYIELESLRFPDGFKYTIHVTPEVDTDNTLVPPMLLQPFVENAIIHGICDKADGKIEISITLEEGQLKCTVTDNGRGFAQGLPNELPVSHNNHVSLGVKITRERLQLLERQKKVPTSFTITGGSANTNRPSGVTVELKLPYEQAF